MRGRDQEWRCVEGLLRTVAAGGTGTLLVEGGPGTGKSRLLEEAAKAAPGWGVGVVRGRAEELGELGPCGMLFAALDLRFEGELPSGDPFARLGSRARVLDRLTAGFQKRARAPLLAVLDDLQWADAATLTMISALRDRLRERPVGWLLSRSTTGGGNQAAALFDLVRRDGAEQLDLAPLAPASAAAMAADLLQGPPDPATRALVDAAGGNPLLIAELIAAVRDGTHPSHRLRPVVRRWVGRLSQDARKLLETAALLGRSFAPEQAAALLATTPAALLPAVEECMTAGLLTATPYGLAFRHDLVRVTVAADIPQPVRHAILDPGPPAADAAETTALKARAELVAGRFDSAVTEAERARELAAASGAPLPAALAATVLATVALRRGDLRRAARHAAELPADTREGRLRRALLTAQVVEAREGPLRAIALLADLPENSWQDDRLLTLEPPVTAWLVRLALAVHDRAAAESVVATAEALAHANPGFPALASAAAHARGLLDNDRDALALAAERAEDVWARASAAEDLGVALGGCGRQEEGAGSLDRALTIYHDLGSARDAARVRKRLRGLGVRHRHWTYADRPPVGWESLTETEHAIAVLVADGYTNRQIAEQMFISAHTVAFHLKHVYRKLRIGSRVELARIAMAQGRIDPEP
ncbi:helix-turn-helix transcriptional regulator [Acrocarpospora catenulata]|uniref:helix-turn-helix transcriptional regulator n=1 Tax=Acrocarpospora catenulata TaxID=2836182 RepID=UPI001BD9FEEE|nr:LuxR family transcriptional regulator [Acrocarpospora catenulata]